MYGSLLVIEVTGEAGKRKTLATERRWDQSMSMSVRLARSAFTSATLSNTFSRLDCEHIFRINFYRCPFNQNSYYLIYFQIRHSFLVKPDSELMKNGGGLLLLMWVHRMQSQRCRVVRSFIWK